MVGIIYGSSMGNTEEAAKLVAANLNLTCDVVNVTDTDAAAVSGYDSLIIGSSTWNDGELQDDWQNFDFDSLSVDGKVVAFFGLGDSSSYGDNFCDAIGELYQIFITKGAKVVGQIPTDGYDYEESKAEFDGKFVGLLLDNDNESEKTEERIANWTQDIKKYFE